MATDWVVNDASYGTNWEMSPGDITWIPLTHQQVPTAAEQGNATPWAHFEPAPSYAMSVRGQISIMMSGLFSDLSDQAGHFLMRIVRNRMDPVTNEPGLPAGSFYSLSDHRDANDDFLWQKMESWNSLTSWISQGNSPNPQYITDVECKVKRRLDPPDQLWLVMEYRNLTVADSPRIDVIPYLRTLIADGPRG